MGATLRSIQRKETSFRWFEDRHIGLVSRSISMLPDNPFQNYSTRLFQGRGAFVEPDCIDRKFERNLQLSVMQTRLYWKLILILRSTHSNLPLPIQDNTLVINEISCSISRQRHPMNRTEPRCTSVIRPVVVSSVTYTTLLHTFWQARGIQKFFLISFSSNISAQFTSFGVRKFQPIFVRRFRSSERSELLVSSWFQMVAENEKYPGS